MPAFFGSHGEGDFVALKRLSFVRGNGAVLKAGCNTDTVKRECLKRGADDSAAFFIRSKSEVIVIPHIQ